MSRYYPEGVIFNSIDNTASISSISGLEEALIKGKILEARALVCDSEHNLIVDLPCPNVKAIIPRIEGAIGIDDGSTRDIALIAKVNKPVCFKVQRLERMGEETVAILSRREAQIECQNYYISELLNGDIIPARITHIEQFGCFVDLACGIPSLIPIDAISVSRISNPSDRFSAGQDIKVIIKGRENGRIWLSHKELLGTWEENAAKFSCGETVSGIVRSVEDYGVFIELAPNLAGLAEPRKDVRAGQHASVYIKSIIENKMKIKLIIVDVFDAGYECGKLNYFVNDNHISYWKYSTPNSPKVIESYFD